MAALGLNACWTLRRPAAPSSCDRRGPDPAGQAANSQDRVGDSGQDVPNQGEADGTGEHDDKLHRRPPGIG